MLFFLLFRRFKSASKLPDVFGRHIFVYHAHTTYRNEMDPFEGPQGPKMETRSLRSVVVNNKTVITWIFPDKIIPDFFNKSPELQ